MKTLRLIYTHFSMDGQTLAYVDVQCTSWCVSNGLLIMYKVSGNSFVPLVQLSSFTELVD